MIQEGFYLAQAAAIPFARANLRIFDLFCASAVMPSCRLRVAAKGRRRCALFVLWACCTILLRRLHGCPVWQQPATLCYITKHRPQRRSRTGRLCTYMTCSTTTLPFACARTTLAHSPVIIRIRFVHPTTTILAAALPLWTYIAAALCGGATFNEMIDRKMAARGYSVIAACATGNRGNPTEIQDVKFASWIPQTRPLSPN
ncbi:hypothetical protein PENSPDRAFT_299575 [Peniophora sp. CONT]|nr:hypothetical protein PENSPDRAFT_299575 [Peniophora sp. CONT]